ncbi:hypothetical protein KGMB02408_34650 [Bacteroides faecalis]|uniref:Uncharacterized protein n=1 Tax=Bacteroides faecalis TaxID=2447885 RepID=A0A401LY87_9BACE|nr:hypothetical protein KGMB02408_34650 [Bacteroides faecalis]
MELFIIRWADSAFSMFLLDEKGLRRRQDAYLAMWYKYGKGIALDWTWDRQLRSPLYGLSG